MFFSLWMFGNLDVALDRHLTVPVSLISGMALSKRFTSIATALVDTSSDDDGSNDDEILQRLLKSKTNYSKIEPSNLGSQPCRDDLGTAGVSDDDLTDEDLDESWEDDFKSLLKTCERQKASSGEENIIKNEKKQACSKDKETRNPVYNIGYAERGSSGSSVETDHIIQGDTVTDKTNSASRLLDRKTDVRSSEIKNQFDNRDQTRYKPSSRLEQSEENDIKKLPSKVNNFEMRHTEIKMSEASKIVSEKRLKDNESTYSTKEIICNEDVNLKGNTDFSVENNNNCKKSSKDQTKHSNFARSCESDKLSRNMDTVHTDRNSSKIEEKFSASHPKDKEQVDVNCERLCDKPMLKQKRVCCIESDRRGSSGKHSEEHKNKTVTLIEESKIKRNFPDKNKSDLPSHKAKKKESKIIKPLIIKQATSFPLDELLPSLPACRKPRASLDSSTNNIHESPTIARKRHKSEMTSSIHQSYAKKQKVDDVQRLISDEVQFPKDNGGVCSNYVPEEIASILAAVDTNQSLLNFFKQKLFADTCNRAPSGHGKTEQSAGSGMKPSGFYKEISEERKAFSNTDIDISENSEELFHLLVQQCSALVKTEEDKSKLQSLVNLLKSESGNEFMGTGFTPEQEDDRKSPPSPYSPKDTLCTEPRFEGRTLLKGGVDPRHIPKNFQVKSGKNKPSDPRITSDYHKCRSHIFPMPKFAEEFWRTEKVKQLRKKQWSINDQYKSKSKKNVKVQNDSISKEGWHDTNISVEQDQLVQTVSNQVINRIQVDTKSVIGDHLSSFSKNSGNEPNSDQNISYDVNNNQETVSGLSGFKGIREPSVYAAVAKVLGCRNELLQQGTITSGEIKHGLENDDTRHSLVSVHQPMSRSDVSSIPVLTGTIGTSAKTKKLHGPYSGSSLVHIHTNERISTASTDSLVKPNTQIGIVKPMPVNSSDVDIREVNMDLSSDFEEGEVNDAKIELLEKKKATLDKRTTKQLEIARDIKKDAANLKNVGNRIEEEGQMTDDTCSSSCSSVSSRSKRSDERYWRRRQEYGYYRRSRYSSSSSVDSRSSERLSGAKNVGLSGHSSKSHCNYSNTKYYDRGHGRHGSSVSSSRMHHHERNKRRYSERNSPKRSEKRTHFEHQQSYRKSNTKEYIHSHNSESKSSSREQSCTKEYVHSRNSKNKSSGREHTSDKRHINQEFKSDRQRRLNEKTRQPSRAVSSVRQSPEVQKVKAYSVDSDSDDPDTKRFSQDYKEKFGCKTDSTHQNSGTSVSHDQYKADREFLLNMQKKFDMADKVKHEIDSVSKQTHGNLQSKEINLEMPTMNAGKHSKAAVPGSSVSLKRSQTDADGVGCFIYSDMFTLADLEHS